ncbi:MAG: esterase [Flavobacteriales bacterium]|jgi:esterase
MKLNFRKTGDGDPLIIAHGLFGSADNWQTLAKKYAENHRVYLVDLRNHGHSPHSDDFNYDLMAEDLHELMLDEQIMFANFIGHSMGGKVIMRYAQRWPEFVEKLIVVDMGMKAYPPHHEKILSALNEINDQHIGSRKQADAILSKYVPERAIKQFLMKNLYWFEKGDLRWRMNVSVLENCMPAILSALPDKFIDADSLFIRGQLSNYILDEDFDYLTSHNRKSQFETINNAGHWLHAEAPEEFFLITTSFLEVF